MSTTSARMSARRIRRVTGAAFALTGLAALGFGAASLPAPESDNAQPVVVADIANTALPKLSFEAGKYMSHRVSDHVDLPPGTVLRFQGLPPGLSYDSATTAIHGTPTTPGTYHPSATAYLGGLPVRTESTTVTITGDAVPGTGGGNTGGGTGGGNTGGTGGTGGGNTGGGAGGTGGGAPAPGIDPAVVDTMPFPPEVKTFIRDAINNINQGLEDMWSAVPAGSLGK